MQKGVIIPLLSNVKDIQQIAYQIFQQIDVSDSTREDYLSRINLYLKFIEQNGFNNQSFVKFKKRIWFYV